MMVMTFQKIHLVYTLQKNVFVFKENPIYKGKYTKIYSEKVKLLTLPMESVTQLCTFLMLIRFKFL